MAKLKLIANPTFKAIVGIPVAGGEPQPVEFTFKHRTKSELDAFLQTLAEKPEVDTTLEIIEGWDLEDKFNKDNVTELLENYIGSAVAIYQVYLDELIRAKAKN